MGGMLSRMMAVSSGDQLWRLYSDRSFDDILGPRPVLDELRRYFFFEPLPFVSRVVFLATPHRGSDLSRGVVGRVSSNLISDPDHIHNLLYQLVKDNPDAFDSRRFRRFPTSIETLDTDSPILTALLEHAAAASASGRQVPLDHRLAATRPGSIRPPTESFPIAAPTSKGVVDERVVRSDHGVQKDPEAIREVRDILLEHVGLPPVAAAAPARPGRPRPEPGRKLETAAREAVNSVDAPRFASILATRRPRILKRSRSMPGTLAQRLAAFALGTHVSRTFPPPWSSKPAGGCSTRSAAPIGALRRARPIDRPQGRRRDIRARPRST